MHSWLNSCIIYSYIVFVLHKDAMIYEKHLNTTGCPDAQILKLFCVGPYLLDISIGASSLFKLYIWSNMADHTLFIW